MDQYPPPIGNTYNCVVNSRCVVAGKIYIVGGFTGRDYLASAEVYDPQTNQWSLIRGMESSRTAVSCIAFRGCLYAIGKNVRYRSSFLQSL